MTDALVLVTGTGRSGTSTMAGTLAHLGLHVPGPFLRENESNPKGFFESRWAVRFHNDLARRAGIQIVDDRPAAFEQARAAVTPRDLRRLDDYLQANAVGHRQTVVKDPRTVWFQQVWADAAARRGLSTRFISMLRHPAEVAASRVTYYAGHEDTPAARQARRRHAILNVARWVNVSLINERETRGQCRAFVRYTDLLADWRPLLVSLGEDLGLSYQIDVASGAPCSVDDFIDAGLRRHDPDWDALEVPASLQQLAQRVWEEQQILCDGHGTDAAASARLDDLAHEYAELLFAANAIDGDQRAAEVKAGIERGAAAAREAALTGPLEQRPVAKVGARDLLKVCGRRAVRRLGR